MCSPETDAIFERLLREAFRPQDLPKPTNLAQATQVVERAIELAGFDPLDRPQADIDQCAKVFLNLTLN